MPMTCVAYRLACHYHDDMDDLAKVVRAVLLDLACSERQLALRAGIDPSLLVRIRMGQRSATPATVRALADALASWAEQSSEGERTLRRALEGVSHE